MINYTTKTFRIRYTETDQMGFAHHSHYLNFFEMARIEWLNSIGFSYAGLEQQGIVMPVVSVNINYKSPAFFDDSLRVKMSIREIPKATINIDYTIINESEKELASGSTKLAFLKSKTKRPVKCPQQLLEIIESL
ncbi:MAG: acyl-CoA thioesterase [Flavobacteriaceae bacterium]|nr:thioesterase family protein [Bacteroidota bacterium]MEC8636162.1 thioesterase family protein [Bacteroidota bacterium]